MARVFLLVLLATLISPASAGPCAIPSAVAMPMTTANTVISPGGGVLVALGFGGLGGGPPQGLEQKGWRYKIGGKLVAPVAIKTLAPGLAVYELPGEGDALTLVDDKQKDLVAVKRAPAKLAELAAPSVKSIVHHTHISRGPRGGGQTRTMTVRFTAQPPAGAVGIILYPAGAAAVAVSWISIVGMPGGTEYVVYATGGRCSFQIPGQSEVAVGARAQIAWVDASGRVSPKSKEIVVVKTTTPPANTIGP